MRQHGMLSATFLLMAGAVSSISQSQQSEGNGFANNFDLLPGQKPDLPEFRVYNEQFLEILGTRPKATLAVQTSLPFAHEAGVYMSSQSSIYVTSNRIGDEEFPLVKISKVSRDLHGKWSIEELDVNITMANGGSRSGSGIVFCAQGNQSVTSGLVYMDSAVPYSTRSLLSDFHGLPFNSPNDVVEHADGSLWFTDPTYGYEQGFRQEPQLPSQVYRLDPRSGDVRAVADGFTRPNGLSFSPDWQTLYITDTGRAHGAGITDLTKPSSIYAFDLVDRYGAPSLTNRRLFAMVGSGIPDGIECDSRGNVYSGCGDGLNVWTPSGVLMGKITYPGGISAFSFLGDGQIALLAETRMFILELDMSVRGAS